MFGARQERVALGGVSLCANKCSLTYTLHMSKQTAPGRASHPAAHPSVRAAEQAGVPARGRSGAGARAATGGGRAANGARGRGGAAARQADAATLASGHRRTRQAHSDERAQDYCESIADLIESSGEARVTDLAKRLGVTHVTVTRTVDRLKRDGLVVRQQYRSIFLTDRGRALAREARERHDVVFRFLRVIGVGEQAAHVDAEGIEHHVSPETLAAMKRHLRDERVTGM